MYIKELLSLIMLLHAYVLCVKHTIKHGHNSTFIFDKTNQAKVWTNHNQTQSNYMHLKSTHSKDQTSPENVSFHKEVSTSSKLWYMFNTSVAPSPSYHLIPSTNTADLYHGETHVMSINSINNRTESGNNKQFEYGGTVEVFKHGSKADGSNSFGTRRRNLTGRIENNLSPITLDNQITWTIPTLLAYSTYSRRYTEKQWSKYILELVNQPLIQCQLETSTNCPSLIGTSLSLLTYVMNVISDLLRITEDNSHVFSQNTCRIGLPSSDQFLFRSYLGRMESLMNCSSSWVILMHQTCSINVTITTKDWHILQVQCRDVHKEGWRGCDDTQLTRSEFLTCLRCFCVSALSISQMKPVYLLIGSVCGHLPPQSVMVAGYAASIVFTQNNHMPNHIEYIMQYQCIQRFIDAYEGKTIVSGENTDVFVHVEPEIQVINHIASQQTSWIRKVLRMFTVTVDLMCYVDWTINMSIQNRCANDDNVNVSVFLVDGPMSATDAFNYFPVHEIIEENQICPFQYQQTWQSTLNDATLITSRPLNRNYESINIIYEAKLIKCQSHFCYAEVKDIVAGEPMPISIYSEGTRICNYTYVMDSSNREYMAINVTHISFDGFYSMSCRYGSLTFYYHDEFDHGAADTLNIGDKYTTYTSPQMPIGTYCSPATIDGLLEFAKPLYLGKGVISVILKTYQFVSRIRVIFSIITSRCHGITQGYLVNKYGDYVNKEKYAEFVSTNTDDAMTNHFIETSFFGVIHVVLEYHDDATITIQIELLPEFCLHYQLLAADYDLSLMSRLWLVKHKTPEAQTTIIKSPKTIIQFMPTNLAIDSAIPSKVMYIWAHVSMVRALRSILSNVRSHNLTSNLHSNRHTGYTNVEAIYMISNNHAHSLGVSTRFTIVTSTVRHIIPLSLGKCYIAYHLVDGIKLLANSKIHVAEEEFPGQSCLLDTRYLKMLKTKRYWQFSVNQHFRDVIYTITSTNKCMPMSTVAYMYTKYESDERFSEFEWHIWYMISQKDSCAISEFQNVTNSSLISLGARHSWRGVNIASDDDTHWTEGCSINIKFDYRKTDPYSGLPPYQAAALVDIKKPYEWRMCRLGSCYMMRDDRRIPRISTWNQAEQFCQSHNGHLLSINSDAEQAVVLDWLTRRPFTRTFDGLSRQAVMGYMAMYLRVSMMFIGLKASPQVGTLSMYI